MSESSPEETLAALRHRRTNAIPVEVVENVGHVVALPLMGRGLLARYALGGWAKVRLPGGIAAGAFIGSYIAQKVHAEEGAFRLAEVVFDSKRLAALDQRLPIWDIKLPILMRRGASSRDCLRESPLVR